MLTIAAATTPVWAVGPFVLLLILIATGPLLFQKFWEHHFAKVAFALAILAAAYVAISQQGGWYHVAESLIEYASFIALVGSLYVVAGGILIRVEGKPSPIRNVALLAIGGAMANVLGTTGAAMLFIRPFLRFNFARMKPYLVVFFIFIVCNVGGALTPIGDPPLFLGYLRGVPFYWMLENFSMQWLAAMGAVLAIFFFLDSRNSGFEHTGSDRMQLDIQGLTQAPYLLSILGLVLVQKAPILHSIPHEVVTLTLAALMGGVAVASLRSASKSILAENEFSFEPLREVAILFVGIFMTMIPALQVLSQHAPTLGIDKPWKFYIITGMLSSVLDNAPTYLCFLSVALGLNNLSIENTSAVGEFLKMTSGVPTVGAISLGAVFWGAMTYIGNGPNFLVRNISAKMGANPPDFITYTFKYAIVFLLPVLLMIIFFLR